MSSNYFNKEGERLLELKAYEQAILMFDKSIEKKDGTGNGETSKLNKGKALIELKRFDQAIDLLNNLVQCNPHIYGANSLIGFALRQLQRYPEAIAAHQKEINNNSNVCWNQLEIGRNFFLQGNYQQSLNWLNAGISNSNASEDQQKDGKYIKAKCLLKLEKFNDCLQILNQLILESNKKQEIYDMYGQIYMKLELFQEAYDNFTESINIQPKNSIKLLQVHALAHLNRYEELIEMCLKLLKDNPSDSSLYTNYSTGLYFLNRYSDSLIVVEKAIEFDSKNVQAYNIKAQSLHQLNRFDEALEVILQAINIDPSYYQNYINQIQTLFKLNRFTEALEASNIALRINSHSDMAFEWKCDILVELKGIQEAIDFCHQTVLFNGEHYVASTMKGDLLFRQSRFKEALEAYDSSIKINPNIEQNYTLKSLALIQLKKYQEAIEECDKALGIDSQCKEALKNKGKAYYFLKSYLNSKTMFLKILEMNPNDIHVLNSMALVCQKQNQLTEALDYLNKAIIIDSNFVKAIISKSKIKKQQKQNLAAQSEFEKVIQIIKSEKSTGLKSSYLAQIKILLRFLDDLKEIVSSLRGQKSRILKDEQLIELNDNFSALGTALNDLWLSKAIEHSDEIVNKSPEQSEKSSFETIFNDMKQSLKNFSEEINRNDYDVDRINEALRKKRKEVLDEQEQSQKEITISNEQNEGVTQQQQQQYPLINDTEIVRLGFMKIEQKERVILDYCKTFFWTSVSLITAYRLIKQDVSVADLDVKSFLEKNDLLLTEGVLQCIRSISDKNVKNEEILLLRQNPVSGEAVICIDAIINSILTMNSKTQQPGKITEEKLRLSKQVIQRKLSSDHEQATGLAFVAIELASMRENELLYPSKSEDNKEFIQGKIEQVKEKSLKSIYIESKNSKAIDVAIRDSVFVIVLFAIYGEQIAEINQPIHQQILKLLSSNKVEEFIALQEKKNSKEPEQKNKQNQARPTEKPKKGCECKIF